MQVIKQALKNGKSLHIGGHLSAHIVLARNGHDLASSYARSERHRVNDIPVPIIPIRGLKEQKETDDEPEDAEKNHCDLEMLRQRHGLVRFSPLLPKTCHLC